MKAAAFSGYGPPDVLRYQDVDEPRVGPRDVLVRVRACAVNHSDLDSRAGTSRWPLEPKPWILGAEFVGVVDALGPGVKSVRTGDLVTALLQYACGQCERCESWRPDICPDLKIFGTDVPGGYGELVSVPERAVVRLRPGDDPLAIASGQCVVSTAWHMVNRLAAIRPGNLVLVPSGSGGVGSVLVQCAKLAGARVISTTSSKSKRELIESLGAEQVVLHGGDNLEPGNLKQALLKAGQRPFDAVLDTVGGPQFRTHLEVLRDDGMLVTCGAHAGEVVDLDVVKLFQHGWRIAGFRMAPPDELRAAVDLIRNGAVKILVDRTFPVNQAAEAHRYLGRRQHVGKVLLVAE